jgi:hypothetical protein
MSSELPDEPLEAKAATPFTENLVTGSGGARLQAASGRTGTSGLTPRIGPGSVGQVAPEMVEKLLWVCV